MMLEKLEPDTDVRTISELLEELSGKYKAKTLSVEQLVKGFHERGFGFFLFIFALPMALPIPVPPGINVLLATPLLLLTAQQAVGRKTIWLPDAILKKRFERESMVSAIEKSLPFTRKLEIFIQPRLAFITQPPISRVIGLLGFIMALAICVPVPLTNTIPSFGIALMAIGVLMRDGLTVCAGAIIGTTWVLLLVFIAILLGTEGIDVFKETIKALL